VREREKREREMEMKLYCIAAILVRDIKQGRGWRARERQREGGGVIV
jgi:hypothetical protein